jgi:hypothetical protein
MVWISDSVLTPWRRATSRTWSTASANAAVGDDGTPTAPQFDDALVAQGLVRAQNGVHVDVEGRRDVAGRREPFTRTHFPTAHRTADRGGDLLMQRGPVCGIDPDQHSLIL